MFYQEDPPNTSKMSKCIASAIKDAFTNCHSFRSKIPETEEPVINFDEEDEIFVSAIISKYMELKSKRKSINNMIIGADSFNWAVSPAVATNIGGGDEEEYFSTGGSRFLSRCSSGTTFDDAFVSAKTCFSRCSSLHINKDTNIDFQDSGIRRRSIIAELMHCEGWPFGLCRKALLLPPLPKSPADSWSWRKRGRVVKIHG